MFVAFFGRMNSEVLVYENVFPHNEPDHIVSPYNGDAIISFKNVTDCFNISKYFKGMSYYNQNVDSENINGLSMNINDRISCVLSHHRWPESRSSEIFQTSSDIGLNAELGGFIYNVGFYENFVCNSNEDDVIVLNEEKLSYKRVSLTEITLDTFFNVNVLRCLDECNANKACHHIEIYKGNVNDDQNVRCKLFSRENLRYETTTHQRYMHFRRSDDYNIIYRDEKDDYLTDTRTLILIFLVIIFAFCGALGLWEYCEVKYFSNEFNSL